MFKWTAAEQPRQKDAAALPPNDINRAEPPMAESTFLENGCPESMQDQRSYTAVVKRGPSWEWLPSWEDVHVIVVSSRGWLRITCYLMINQCFPRLSCFQFMP